MPMILYPWIEQWATGDRREHHLLDRPRNVPTRTGLGVMAITFYLLLLISGGNDIIASQLHLSINDITNTLRLLVFVAPPLAFMVAKRICLGLQRKDREKVLHGRETGTIYRTETGEFFEVHAPLDEYSRWTLVQYEGHRPLELPPGGRRERRPPSGFPLRRGPAPPQPLLLRGPGPAGHAARSSRPLTASTTRSRARTTRRPNAPRSRPAQQATDVAAVRLPTSGGSANAARGRPARFGQGPSSSALCWAVAPTPPSARAAGDRASAGAPAPPDPCGVSRRGWASVRAAKRVIAHAGSHA